MLSNQQDVVRNGRRQSVERAYGLAEELFHQLFPQDHPYYADVIGSHADVQSAKLEDVRGFFKSYYAPNNATLALIGDIDEAKTKALVEKYFGTIAKGPDVPAVSVTTPPITTERRLAMTDQVELPRIYMSWLTSPYYKPGDARSRHDGTVRIWAAAARRLGKSLVYEEEDRRGTHGPAAIGRESPRSSRSSPPPASHTAEELEAAINHELDFAAGRGAERGGAGRGHRTGSTGNIITSLGNLVASGVAIGCRPTTTTSERRIT
jgi:zinc protease